jgi:hypothetical protein
MGMGTGGIPTTKNIPETTEIFGFPTDNIPDNRFFEIINFIISIKKSVVGFIVGWPPEFFGCLGYIVSCGYPTRTHTHTRGNSVAHVCILIWPFKYAKCERPGTLLSVRMIFNENERSRDRK